MELALALFVGALVGGGFYMMLRRNVVKMLIGLVLLSNGANLLIFLAARPVRGRSAIVPQGQTAPEPPYADPLAQALILTAIVIGFGVLAFAIALVYRTEVETGSDDIDDYVEGERP